MTVRPILHAAVLVVLLVALWGPSFASARCVTHYTEEFLTLELAGPPTVDGTTASAEETARWASEGELIQNFINDSLTLVARADDTNIALRDAE